MKNSILLLTFCTALLAMSCGNAKDKLNQAGEKVGEGTSEFFSGVGEGIGNTRECTLEVAEAFTEQGITAGKFTIHALDESSTVDNVVSIYLMFEQDYRGPISVKVFDSTGKEYGRINQEIAGVKGQASFYDFIFDTRTDIEARSKIVVE